MKTIISVSARAPSLATLLKTQQRLQAELAEVAASIKEAKAKERAAAPAKVVEKPTKLPTACTETAHIPTKLKGKFSSRLSALEKKHGITRAGVSTRPSKLRGQSNYTFHYAKQPGWSAFKSAIHGLWTKFVADYPSAKKNMR